MNNAEVILLAQLLNAMNEAVDKLDQAYNSKKLEDVENLKKELVNLQKKVNDIVK